MRLKASVDTCDGRWDWEERSLMIASHVHCIRPNIDLRMESWWIGPLSRCFPRMENWSVSCPGRRICQSMKQELRVNICKSKSDLIAWVARREAHCVPKHSVILSARMISRNPLLLCKSDRITLPSCPSVYRIF